MKWILLLLFSFSVYAQSESAPSAPLVYCGIGSHEEIDACSLEDKIHEVLPRLYPSHSPTTELQYNMEDPCDPLTVDDPETTEEETCPPWDQKTGRYYFAKTTYDDETGLPDDSLFQRLVMLNKPATSASFQEELLVWKQEKKDIFDFLQSLNLDRFRRRMGKCGYSNPNIALFKAELAKNIDTIKRDCLLSHTAALDLEDAKAQALEIRVKDEAFGVSLINEILILVPPDMPSSDKLELLDHVAPIERLLRLGDIDGARDITTLTPTTAEFSQPLKEFIIDKCNSYLGE